MKDVYYPSQEPEGRTANERYDLVGMRSQSRHGSGSMRFHQGTFAALWATKFPVREQDTPSDYLDTEYIVSRHNEDNQEFEELVRTTDKRAARRYFDALAEEFPQSDLPLFEKLQGRPSQGRSVRVQANITPEQAVRLEMRRQPDDKGMSDIIYRLIDEVCQ